MPLLSNKAIRGFRLKHANSTRAIFNWSPQSNAHCQLTNVTIKLHKRDTGGVIVWPCPISKTEQITQCIVSGLEPNTAYNASAIGCSVVAPNCAKETDGIEVLTRPGGKLM